MKIKALALLCGLLTILCGCSAERFTPDANAFYIEVKVDRRDIYAIECEYSLGGEKQGGRLIQNAKPQTPIPIGETLYFKFLPKDFEFPENVKNKKFCAVFTVVDMDGNDLPAGTWEGFISYGEERFLTLSGEDGNCLLQSEV